MSRNPSQNKAKGGAQRSSMGSRNSQQQQQSQKPKLKKNVQRPTRGLGANSTSVASAYSSQATSGSPKIQYGPNGKSCRVAHREFIQNISGTVNFAVPVFLPLNPGLAGTFPWLSNIANNFEQYRVHKMRFCCLTRTGTNVPGSILIAPDYDATDAAPVSEQILSNYAELVEDAPWKDICCQLRPAGMHALGPKKFVRNGLIPGQDLKTTDVGSIIVATVDGTAVNWAKLWVEYDVEFFEPQLNPQGSGLASTAQGTAGTAVSVISANLSISGSLISGVVLNVVSLQNLVQGAEYYISGSATTAAAGFTFSAPVGLTLKSVLNAGANASGATYTATATVGSVTITSGNSTNVLIVATPITIGAI